MDQETNVQVTAAAGAATTVLMWLVGTFAPSLLAMPGTEAFVTSLALVILGYVSKNAKIIGS